MLIFAKFIGTGFRNYVQAILNIGAQYGTRDSHDLILSRKKLTGNVMVAEYNRIKDLLTTDLLNKHMAFTTDMWTDQFTQRSFLCLSAHYIDESFCLKTSI